MVQGKRTQTRMQTENRNLSRLREKKDQSLGCQGNRGQVSKEEGPAENEP